MAYVSQFGWPGDDGLGERLIQRILAGTKTATCAPLASLAPEALQAMRAAVGTEVAVVDKDGVVRATILLRRVYETPFGQPAESLLAGEGFSGDPAGFQEAHRQAWAGWLETCGITLDEATPLLVEEFTLVPPRDC